MRGEIWNFKYKGNLISVYQPAGGGYAEPQIKTGSAFRSNAENTYTHPTIVTDHPMHNVGKFEIDLRDHILSGNDDMSRSQHPMAQSWLDWQPIDMAPNTGEQILTGFMGQHGWMSFVDPAFGADTGQHQPHAKPTHWAPIHPPANLSQ